MADKDKFYIFRLENGKVIITDDLFPYVGHIAKEISLTLTYKELEKLYDDMAGMVFKWMSGEDDE